MKDEFENVGPLEEMQPSDVVADAALGSLLRRFGGDYNRPPEFVPREEMWQAIRQGQAPRALIHRHPGWNMLVAATLLLGIGIGIGIDAHSHVTSTPRAAQPKQASVASVVSDSAHPAQAAAATVAPLEPLRSGERGNRRLASSAGRGSDFHGDVVSRDNAVGSASYSLATVRHFTAVEALLTSYQRSPHDARGDAQMAAWARALLSQTRLLLDSPAASDPARQRLLQDLELVLVQMSQLSPSDAPIDREMIDGSVRHSNVITRLRTAVPAGGLTHL